MPDSLPQRIERVMVDAQLIPSNIKLPLPETTLLAEDLGIDSIDVLDLMMALEDEFDITIRDEEQEGLQSIGDLVKFVESRTGAQPAGA